MIRILLIVVTVISFLPIMSIAQVETCPSGDEKCQRELDFINSPEYNGIKKKSSCGRWHYMYDNARKLDGPKPAGCIINDLLHNKLKYVGKYNYTNKAINTTNVEVDDSGEPTLNRQMQAETVEVDTNNGANLFSIGLEYKITTKDILGAFNQKIANEQDYYLFEFIGLKGLEFNTSYQYTNTGTDNNLDTASFDVKTEKEFKYIVGISYTGCITDIFKGRLGCHDYEADIEGAKKEFLKSNPPPDKKNAAQDKKIAALENEIKKLQNGINQKENR